MRLRALLFLLLTTSFELWAQAPKGIIPREYLNRPATDLVYKGKVLLPEEAHDLYNDNKGHFDLSTLNPVEDTDIWKNIYPSSLKNDSNEIPINEMDEVTYESPIASRSGNFRFNVSLENEFGVPVLYNMLISKKTHGYLMNRALLRKVGFNVPAMKYLSKIKINFSGLQDKKKFMAYLEHEAMAGDAENWVVEELDNGSIIVQDLVVMEGSSDIYNLAMGPITNDIILGRRLFSSLSIPLSITNMIESVNMMRWQAATVNNDAISLNLENAEDFQTSWEDARWILRRIGELSRSDFEEVARESHTPPAVQMILTEKIIARRNNLMKLFKVDKNLIEVNSKINYGVELVEGKLTQEDWPGYASRFAYGDPDSPLSTSEISAWIKSKAIQIAIDAAMSAVNWKLTMTDWKFGKDGSDINQDEVKKYFESNKDAVFANGPGFHMPIGAWTYPTLGGNLIMTRNITTGTFLGTDNLINLVDVIGFQVSIGMGAAGIMYPGKVYDDGLNAQGQTKLGFPTPINFGGSANVSYARSWAHLRPVTSMSKALKYPFKNILVPMLKNQYGKKLSEIVTMDFDQMSESERELKIKEAISSLTKELEVGESIIVTDSLILGASGSAMYNYMNWVKLQLGLGVNQNVIGRFHIHRKSENAIHIYRDFGNVRSIKVNLNIDSVIPVMSVGAKAASGEARTKFYKVVLNPSDKDIIKTLGALRSAFMTSSLKKLERIQKPYVLKHKFAEKQTQAKIFTWQFNRINSHTKLSVQHPEGEKRDFYRAYYAKSTGMNYQDYVMNTLTTILANYAKFNLNSSQTSSNPGYSFYGKAQNRILTYEGEINSSNNRLERPFMKLTRIWNGWSIKAKNAEKILQKIKNRYRFEFYEPTVLNDTNKLSLYNISVNILVYETGIKYLKSLDEKMIKRIFANNQYQKSPRINPTKKTDEQIMDSEGKLKDKTNNGIERFLRRLAKAKKFSEKGNLNKETQMMLRAFAVAEKKLNAEGLSLLFGGPKNFLINSRIDGYRVGDEDGDKSIYSNMLGEVGARESSGPLQNMLQHTEMLEGEFFIYWLMTRVI